MKRLFLILLVLLCAVNIFAKGAQERKITVLFTVDGPKDRTLWKDAAEATKAKFPGLEVEFLKVDLSTGAPVSMDTLIAAGTPPDIYGDTMVRTSRYIVPEFAMAVNDYMDVSDYAYLEPLTRNGKVLALPTQGGAQGMILNLDLLEAAGYTVPDNWTIGDFMTMCGKVKAYADKTGKEVYGTGLFAGNQSGDYLWMQWFASFGVDLYSDNYVASTQNEGGAAVWEFFKSLKNSGFVPNNSATLTDDDYALQWSKGMYAACAFFPNWVDMYFKSAMEQGLIKEPFRYKFVEFPNNAPACTSYEGVVVNKNTKYPAEVIEFVKNITSIESMNVRIKILSSVAYRKGATAKPDDSHAIEIDQIVAANGVYDLGVSNSWFAEVRAQGFPVLQSVLSGKITAAEAAELYTKKVNEIIQ